MRLTTTLLALVCVPALALAQGREPTQRHVNGIPQQSGGFGIHTEALGDLDGDGWPDWAVAANNFQVLPGQSLGRVYAYSGRSGALIRTFDGDQVGADFGLSMADVGDVNGDGVRDLAIGSPSYNVSGLGNNTGRVTCFSGADASVLWTTDGDEAFANFGKHLEPLGSTASGAPHLAVAQPGWDTPSLGGAGRIVSLSADDGLYAGHVEGDLALRGLGTTMASYPETALVYAGTNHGAVYDASWVTGAHAATELISASGPADFVTLAMLSGPAGGGPMRFAMGKRSADTSGLANNGTIEVFSLGGGLPLLTIEGSHSNSSVGLSMAGVRDSDGDGDDELVYIEQGTAFNQPGTLRVIDLETGAVLDELLDIQGSTSFASINDVSGDGRGEWIASVDGGTAQVYEARLFSQGMSRTPGGAGLGGFTTTFDIDLGPGHAGRTYGQLYSFSGASPGTVGAPGWPLAALNLDADTITILGLFGTPLFPDAFGTLDGAGRTTTLMTFTPHITNLAAGMEMTTVAFALDATDTDVVVASNPQTYVVE